MRIDEGGRKQKSGAVDHTVAVGVEPLAKRRDRAAVDPDVEHRIDALGGIEHTRSTDDDVVGAAAADQDRHAIPTALSTATGHVVSRS